MKELTNYKVIPTKIIEDEQIKKEIEINMFMEFLIDDITPDELQKGFKLIKDEENSYTFANGEMQDITRIKLTIQY